MSDQAARLRALAAQNRYQTDIDEIADTGSAKTIAVTSGKGGVGKSNVSLNLSIALANSGHRVLLVDADLNLANLDILLGITPRHTFRDVVRGHRLLEDIVVQCPQGFDLLPANSGALDLWDIDRSVTAPIFRQLAGLESLYDFVVIDTAAGISPFVIDFVVSSHEILVVALPEPTSMMDAYAVIKMASRRADGCEGAKSRIRVVLNQVRRKEEAKNTFAQIQKAVTHFLGFTIEPAGIIPMDEHVSRAVKLRKPLLSAFPGSPASKSLYALAGKFSPGFHRGGGNGTSFFQRLWKRKSSDIL